MNVSPIVWQFRCNCAITRTKIRKSRIQGISFISNKRLEKRPLGSHKTISARDHEISSEIGLLSSQNWRYHFIYCSSFLPFVLVGADGDKTDCLLSFNVDVSWNSANILCNRFHLSLRFDHFKRSMCRQSLLNLFDDQIPWYIYHFYRSIMLSIRATFMNCFRQYIPKIQQCNSRSVWCQSDHSPGNSFFNKASLQ